MILLDRPFAAKIVDREDFEIRAVPDTVKLAVAARIDPRDDSVSE
jgi:hypothetical protein